MKVIERGKGKKGGERQGRGEGGKEIERSGGEGSRKMVRKKRHAENESERKAQGQGDEEATKRTTYCAISYNI